MQKSKMLMLSKIYVSITCLVFVSYTVSASYRSTKGSPVPNKFSNKFIPNNNIPEINSDSYLFISSLTSTTPRPVINSQLVINTLEKKYEYVEIANDINNVLFLPSDSRYLDDELNNDVDTSIQKEQTENTIVKDKKNTDRTTITSLLSSNDLTDNAKGYAQLGRALSDKNKFDSAEYYFSKAEKIYLSQKVHDSLFMNLYGDWAHLHYLKADYGKAQEYNFKMLDAAEISGDIFKIAIANTMVAQLFNEIKQAPKAIFYTRKAVELLPKITSPSLKNYLIYTLASRYLWHYQDTKNSTSLDTSELLSNQLLLLAKKQNDKKDISRAFQSLESIAFEKGALLKSLHLLDSALQYTDTKNYLELRLIYYDKADLLVQMRRYDAAQTCADSVLLLDKLVENKANIADAYALISKIAREKGDFKKALEYKELEKGLNDSLTNLERTASVAELEEKYNQAKNEKTIVDLAKQKQLYFSLAIAALLVTVIIALFLRQQSLKNKKEILEAEQRLNRARMNPHFLFNALTSLQKIALTENDKNKWVSSLSKFSNIMRATLESTYKEYITIELEIEFLYEYFEVQKNRFANGLLYEVIADDIVEVNELFIPPMLIQPFVENSIEHGLNNIDYTASIQVEFSIVSDELLITIKDNGRGLGDANTKTNMTHISRANQIIQERIYLLNLKQKSKARYLVEEDTEQKGVIVKLYLPLLYKEQIIVV